MKMDEAILQGYENARLIQYKQVGSSFPHTVRYDDLPKMQRAGVLKVNQYIDGVLTQTYTEHENHVGVIAATRLGKTTSYVIPTVLSFAHQKQKKSMIISDPKGEIFRHTRKTLQKEGYKVKLLNFRDSKHSEYWNPLTPIFRKYRKVQEIPNEVEIVQTRKGLRNCFRGKIYHSQDALDRDLRNIQAVGMEDVEKEIDDIARLLIVTTDTKNPYWEDSARDFLKGLFWAMLEDSDKGLITEDTFSFNTILRIVGTMLSLRDDLDDGQYFTGRSKNSKSYLIVKSIIIENAPLTRQCVLSTFMTKVSLFRESTVRLLTSCNTFEISELTDEPTALFIDFRDEVKAHYQIIGMFVQDVYRFLIEKANKSPNGKLDVPFYFVLDEFGNFPPLRDFETVITNCAGRNVFFILIVQSYAQLDAVYDNKVSKIIRDNLNVHVFFGSNNPETLEAFSNECGEYTRISPLSALNGQGAQIEHYELEHIPLVPKSRLSHFEPGECIVTEVNSGYVMFSRMERYYLCKEFQDLPLSSTSEYVSHVNPYDERYTFNPKNITYRLLFLVQCRDNKIRQLDSKSGKESLVSYMKLVEQIRDDFKRGESRTIPELQSKYGVSYGVVRDIVSELERIGVIHCQKGILFERTECDPEKEFADFFLDDESKEQAFSSLFDEDEDEDEDEEVADVMNDPENFPKSKEEDLRAEEIEILRNDISAAARKDLHEKFENIEDDWPKKFVVHLSAEGKKQIIRLVQEGKNGMLGEAFHLIQEGGKLFFSDNGTTMRILQKELENQNSADIFKKYLAENSIINDRGVLKVHIGNPREATKALILFSMDLEELFSLLC